MSDKRGPLDSLAGMVPTLADRPELTIKLRLFEDWSRLTGVDLCHNDVRESRSSTFLQEIQRRLKLKRHIDDATSKKYDVRAVLRSLRCCRPADFRCSVLLFDGLSTVFGLFREGHNGNQHVATGPSNRK